jgi:flagellin FlaB
VYVEKRGIYILRVRVHKSAAIGIGAMIVFIAMVLVAGMAAYVLLSTSSQLQTKSGVTGEQTMKEASTGLKISSIEGHNTSGVIDKLLFCISLRPGSQDIDLSTTRIELSNGSAKCIVKYSATYLINGKSGSTNLFAEHAFPPVASEFGLIVVKDDDNSCSSTAVMNKDDSVLIAMNTTACFHGITNNANIEGYIIPENGAWGIINFRTPSSFTSPIVVLQED